MSMEWGMSANVTGQNVSGEISEEARFEHWNISLAQRALTGAVMGSCCLVIMVANLGIVYYEMKASANYRTAIDRLAALISIYQMFLALGPFPIMTYRVLAGRGLGETFCSLGYAIAAFSLTQVVLAYNQCTILRYVYICKLGTVGTIKEDFVIKFFVGFNLVMGIFVSLTLSMAKHMVVPTGYSYCINRILPGDYANFVLR